MNTPLQRLVDRARSPQQHPALRIEPLFGAPFATPADLVHGLPEADIETAPPARVSGIKPVPGPVHAHPPRAAARADMGRTAAGRHGDPAGVPPSSPNVPHSEPSAATDDGQAGTRLARNQPAAAVKAAPARDSLHHDVVRTAAQVLTGRAPSRPGTPPGPIAAAQQHTLLAPIEAAPSITIAIGRVEVRNAPTPAGSPRRPFKPSLSLDAFLRRGKGDG